MSAPTMQREARELRMVLASRQKTDFTIFEPWSDQGPGPVAELFREARARAAGTTKPEDITSVEAGVILEGRNRLVVRARAAICKCFEGKYLSATFRIVGEVPKHFLPSEATTISLDQSPFFETSPESDSPRKETVPKLLYDRLWPNDATASGELTGLIYITGATKSGKNFQAKALIHQYLSDRRFVEHWTATRGRRAHLITFEEPIETYMSKAPQDLRGKGIDYTPRQRGSDAGSLKEVLANALRQTPAILFVAETRDNSELRQLVDFAGSGHLVVTTGHAYSLSESLGKLLAACRATTPSARREVADKLCAVVSLTPRALESNAQQLVRVPTLFRANSLGKQALMAEGRTCLLPYSGAGTGYCWGRRWFVEKMEDLSKSDRTQLGHWASVQDLVGL